MSSKKRAHTTTQRKQTIDEVLIELYLAYAESVSEDLWAWERERWYELVFCILQTIGEPKISRGSLESLMSVFWDFGLVEPERLAGTKRDPDDQQIADPLLVTIDHMLQQVGFPAPEASKALTAMCDAAQSIQDKYQGKLQMCLRNQANHMLTQVEKELGFSEFEDSEKALALWMQNTLNMPLPVSNPYADQACERLGVSYAEMVEAADRLDINVALLDDALRAYWDDELATPDE